MKELDHFVLGKGLFATVKGRLPFTKGHSRQSRGKGGGRTPLIGSYF